MEVEHPTRHRAYAVYALLLVNTAAGVLSIVGGPTDVYKDFGFIPDDPDWADVATSMFLHGSLWHFLGNMFFLWMFGDNVEDVVGPVPFVVTYFVSGAAASGAHLLLGSAGDIPLIGASGAISGILGVYLVFFPRIPTDLALVLFHWELKTFHVTAVGAVGAWVAVQLLFGLLTSATGLDEFVGIAFWAHVGGLLAGAALGGAFLLFGFIRRYDEASSPRNPLLGYVCEA